MENTDPGMIELSGNDVTEIGPNDIVVHLVNPYKCGICEEEYLEHPVFMVCLKICVLIRLLHALHSFQKKKKLKKKLKKKHFLPSKQSVIIHV